MARRVLLRRHDAARDRAAHVPPLTRISAVSRVARHNREQIVRSLRRLDPAVEISPATEFVTPEERKRGVPIVHLFHDGRALGTLLLWVVNFMNLLNIYFLSNWLPIVVSSAGYRTPSR